MPNTTGKYSFVKEDQCFTPVEQFQDIYHGAYWEAMQHGVSCWVFYTKKGYEILAGFCVAN